jgi:hypothetical protein
LQVLLLRCSLLACKLSAHMPAVVLLLLLYGLLVLLIYFPLLLLLPAVLFWLNF